MPTTNPPLALRIPLRSVEASLSGTGVPENCGGRRKCQKRIQGKHRHTPKRTSLNVTISVDLTTFGPSRDRSSVPTNRPRPSVLNSGRSIATKWATRIDLALGQYIMPYRKLTTSDALTFDFYSSSDVNSPRDTSEGAAGATSNRPWRGVGARGWIRPSLGSRRSSENGSLQCSLMGACERDPTTEDP